MHGHLDGGQSEGNHGLTGVPCPFQLRPPGRIQGRARHSTSIVSALGAMRNHRQGHLGRSRSAGGGGGAGATAAFAFARASNITLKCKRIFFFYFLDTADSTVVPFGEDPGSREDAAPLQKGLADRDEGDFLRHGPDIWAVALGRPELPAASAC